MEVGISARGTCTKNKRGGTPCGEGATEKRGGSIPFREGVKGYVEMKKLKKRKVERKRKEREGAFSGAGGNEAQKTRSVILVK